MMASVRDPVLLSGPCVGGNDDYGLLV